MPDTELGEAKRAVARYRLLFDSIDTGFCTIKVLFDGERPVDYRFLDVNPAFARHTGLADVIGRDIRELVPGHEQHWFDIYGKVAVTGEPTRFEAGADALGNRWFEVYAFRVDEPEERHVAVLFTDISERKQIREMLNRSRDHLEQQVRERTASLENTLLALREETAERQRTEELLRQSQKMEAIGQLTGGIAHDFNNLLAAITGSLEMLERRVARGEVAGLDRYLSTAREAADRAAALTHRLLTFSRRHPINPQPTDIEALIGGMADLIRRTVGPAISVEIRCAPIGPWIVRVDSNRCENALLNLCINARDAMPEGGELEIGIAGGERAEAAVSALGLPPGEYMTLYVKDSGTGMSPEIAARAFDPFFTTKPQGQGTGLGLSMIYNFAQQSGGGARILSALGEGTCVCLYLPRHAGTVEPDTAASHAAEIPRGAGETILVIEDEPALRMLLREALEDCGYAVTEAADGSAGLEVLRSDAEVDLLIADLGLPGRLDGRQLADLAREIRPGLRTLFITGYDRDGEAMAIESGPDLLTKPFTMDMLAARLRDLLRGR